MWPQQSKLEVTTNRVLLWFIVQPGNWLTEHKHTSWIKSIHTYSVHCVYDFTWDHTTAQLPGRVIGQVEDNVIILSPARLTCSIFDPVWKHYIVPLEPEPYVHPALPWQTRVTDIYTVLSLINAPGALQFFKRGMSIRGKFSMQKCSV